MAWSVISATEGMAVKKHLPYNPFLKKASMDLVESGHMERLKLEYESSKICDPISIDDGVPLSYQKLVLLFIIIGGGMTFAMMVLIYEILKNHCRHKEKSKIFQMELKEPKFKVVATQTK